MISKTAINHRLLQLACVVLGAANLAACSFGSTQPPVQLSSVSRCSAEQALVVSFLDVGQGAATLIRCPDGKTQALIDAGNSDENYLNAEALFQKAFFERMGDDRTLELALATHQDIDHIFGFIDLLSRVATQQFTISTYLDNGGDHLDHLIDNQVWQLIEQTKTNRIDVAASDTRTVQLCPEVPGQSPEVLMELHFPRGQDRTFLNCERNYNDCSVATRFSFAGKSVYLAADQSLTSEQAMSDAALLALDSDVLLSGHHGNASTSERLLRAVSPKLAVVSTGLPDSAKTTWWSYPEKSVVRRIRWALPSVESEEPIEARSIRAATRKEGWETTSAPINFLSTAVDGTIDLYLSSTGICVERERFDNYLQFTW